MSDQYQQQVRCSSAEIDMGFWRQPHGAKVPDDELEFLLIPDEVEAKAIFEVSQQVHHYQLENLINGGAISKALIVTMGGMLPGVLLHDHLVNGRAPGVPKIEFGTIGVSLYKGPGERYDNPLVQHDISIAVIEQTVLVIDDLGDRGGTMDFLVNYVQDSGASRVLTLALYMKPAAQDRCPADFWFGETPQHTWIITPRERVETIVKRVPVWIERGADQGECYRRLVDIIGYPVDLVEYYLPRVFSNGQSKEQRQ